LPARALASEWRRLTEQAVSNERLARAREERAKRNVRRSRLRFAGCAAALGLVASCGAACVWLFGEQSGRSDPVYTDWGAAQLGDVDGDGTADFALNTRFDPRDESDAPSTWVLSGKTAAPLYELQFELPRDSDSTGTARRAVALLAFADVGDVDGDGGSDYCVGLPESPWHEDEHASELRLLSGRTGASIWTVRGERGERIGSIAIPIGDLDGDRVADVLVTAEGSWLHGRPEAIELRSGASSSLIARIDGPRVPDASESFPNAIDHTGFGASASALGDVDSDGVPDFAVGAPNTLDHAGSILAYSGRTHELLWSTKGEA